MKYLLIVVVLAVVAFLAYRRLRGSGSSLPRTDELRQEFREGEGKHDDPDAP